MLNKPTVPFNPAVNMHPFFPLSLAHRLTLRAVLPLLLLLAMAGCKQHKQATAKDLYGTLEVTGKINTFPLYVVVSDSLPGNTFPADIRELCGLSQGACKTLPDAGLLRAGADVYYKYNCFDEMAIPEDAEDEAAVTKSVREQVNTYFAKTTLQHYDSLRTANLPDWNVGDFPAMYVGNSSDSIFFYSNQPGAPATYEAGGKSFPVYTSVPELRARIDQIVCRGYAKVAVFYNAPAASGAAPAPRATTSPKSPESAPSLFAARGSRAGDSCVETSRYEKLHDGSGGFMLGRLLKSNSTACGFVNTSPALAAPPQEPAARPVTKPAAPSRNEPALGEEYDNPAPVRKDNQCFRRSEPVCEQDESKNYTGRRVQYCYNKAGQIVRTIVISKCEADCRCF